MSALPPYSTYRTDNKQMRYPQATSHGNILTFTPPGFKQSLNVKFPDSRLAVCEKCKKNFKTRDMCRVRNSHTSAPWTTAYICLTLDETCTDEEGKFIDKPLTVRMVQWTPYKAKKPFDPKTPVCSSCKKTNRTRSFCRERHKHRHLPWCTVYVLLSALETADPQTVVADPSKPVTEGDNGCEKTAGSPKSEKDATSPGEASAAESKASSIDGENFKPNKGESQGEAGDNINDIAPSRTFLAKVNCEGTSIHWLELNEYEGADTPYRTDGPYRMAQHGVPDPAYVMPHPMPPGDPSQHAHYYNPGYPPQQGAAANNPHPYYYQMHPQQYAAWHAAHQQQQYRMPPPHQQHHMHAPTGPGQHMDSSASPVPVTAGEAAAHQQQKRHRDDGSGTSPPPPPPHMAAYPAPPHHPAGQQQQWMAYQQMYQAQLPPPAGAPGTPVHYPPRVPGQQSEGVRSPAPGGVSGSGGGDSSVYGTPTSQQEQGDEEEHENKRQRRS